MDFGDILLQWENSQKEDVLNKKNAGKKMMPILKIQFIKKRQMQILLNRVLPANKMPRKLKFSVKL